MTTQTGEVVEPQTDEDQDEEETFVVVIDGMIDGNQAVLEVERSFPKGLPFGGVEAVINDDDTVLLAGIPMVDINGWYVARDRIVAIVPKWALKAQRAKVRIG